MAKKYFWNGNWHTVPNPYGGSGMFAGVRVTPPPPPIPPPTTPPPDATYDTQVANAGGRYSDTLAQLQKQQGDTLSSFGLDDSSDPFSRARLLQQSFDRAKLGATNNYAARGQLYSGALQNSQNLNITNYNQGRDQLRKQQTSILDDIAARRAAAGRDQQDSVAAAGSDRVARAVATPVDPSTVPAPQTQTKTSYPKKKRRPGIVV